ncbi:MAG TPA: 2-oxoglutarate dehydrogenase complex dihydrolipoyllysine-residue succinyltransferase, partial [Methylomirabilota bacterium]|nr:2-oxoglutarate dehydrogenase complex dihydrolipoyllysine-residue succinyltransferase [Methylomirabilota bacterium]
MSIQLKVPSLGESITQATVGAWLKKEGEPILADEPVVEVESEKATVALPAPAAGVLGRVLRNTGETVVVGEVIGELEESAASAAAGASPFGSGPAPAGPQVPEGPRPGAGGDGTPAASVAAGGRRAPPSARRLMAERGVAPDRVEGSGPGGQIRKEDVVRVLEARPAPAPGRADGGAARERVVPMTSLRRTVARRLVEAQRTAAILTTFNEIDMSRVLALRDRHGEGFLARHGVKLGFMSFFVKAAVEALRQFPVVNAEVRGEAIVYKDRYDVGVAVGGGKGLVVPVVRDADQLSFAEIEKAIGELARKAKENRLSMDELSGGTFTISNGGIYGSLLSTPILNPPQSGILGLHKIERRAVVLEGDQIVARPMMYAALS